MDFFTSQDRARRNTGMLVVLYVLAVFAIILGVYAAVRAIVFYQEMKADGTPSEFFDPKLLLYSGGGTLVIVGGATMMKILELGSGGEVVAEALGGTRIDPGTHDKVERKVLNVVQEMAIASGMAVPDVYMLGDENRINAFAAGTRVDEAVIGVTRGCVEQLSRDELQGVIAHEFSHILHGDMKLNLRLVGVLHGILVIGLIGSFVMRSAFYTGASRSRDNKGGMMMIVLGLALFLIGMLGTFFGRLIQSAVSRQREFLADASAVRFTRQPGGIAGALKRIGAREHGARIHSGKVEEYRHLYFGAGTSEFLSLLATHPPLEERIKRIEPRWNGLFPEPKPPALKEEMPPMKAPLAGPTPQETMKRVLGAAVLTGAIDQVGRPTYDHLEQARALIGGLPPRIRDAIQTLDGARAVVCATLIDADRGSRQKQMLYLEGRGNQFRDDVVNYLSLMQPQGPGVRLPLVELAMPVLRHMTEQEYRELMEDVDYLSRTDQVIEPFEWVLGRVLRHHIGPQFSKQKRSEKRTGKLADSRDDALLLLTLIARSGHADPTMQDTAFEMGVALLDAPDARMVPPNRATLPALDEAMDRLTLLAAGEKKKLLEACAAVIAADNQVTTTEAEFLRGISEVFECPMPVVTT